MRYAASMDRSKPAMSLYCKPGMGMSAEHEEKKPRLTATGVTQPFASSDPVCVVTTISDEVQTLSGGEYLELCQDGRQQDEDERQHTFLPKSSPTNKGSISLRNWYFVSHKRRPLSLSPDMSSPSPLPANPPSPASWPEPVTSVDACTYCRWASSGSTDTKNSEYGSYSSPEKSHLCSVEKNGFDTCASNLLIA